MPTDARFDVGCQRCKVDVTNELGGVWFMSFDKLEDVACTPKI